jgi:cytoskeletal protein CcmA (bactofilin family)/DNA-directed RNA polymerase subunit RPC12/RpoP
MKSAKVTVACPHCGHGQPESSDAYSTVCKKCGRYFRVQEALHPAARPAGKQPDRKQVTCFQCGTLLEVPVAAQSTMCKRCSTYVDLCDYRIDSAVSKNFRTHGAFVIEDKGYVFNTEVDVGDAVIKGRLLGKLVAHRSLTLHSTAQIRGTFQTALLVIPAGNHFRWPTPLALGGADIAGELVATVQATETVRVRDTGRLFGDVTARNLVIEPGAVLVGAMKIGRAS